MSKITIILLLSIALVEMGFIEGATTSCSTNPCLNGATCSPLTATTFNCTCAPNFTGNKCETCNHFRLFEWVYVYLNFYDLVNQCSNQPCFNNGTCNQTLTGYKCVCPKYYSGSNCQYSKFESLLICLKHRPPHPLRFFNI